MHHMPTIIHCICHLTLKTAMVVYAPFHSSPIGCNKIRLAVVLLPCTNQAYQNNNDKNNHPIQATAELLQKTK